VAVRVEASDSAVGGAPGDIATAARPGVSTGKVLSEVVADSFAAAVSAEAGDGAVDDVIGGVDDGVAGDVALALRWCLSVADGIGAVSGRTVATLAVEVGSVADGVADCSLVDSGSKGMATIEDAGADRSDGSARKCATKALDIHTKFSTNSGV
jgi:hypothetical protein